MTTKPIIESGMTFGPYPDGYCFYIEQSETLKQLNKHAKKDEGVLIAELLLLRIGNAKNTIWIIEAKSSSPKPDNAVKFDEYITEIKEKLTNSLILSVAMYLKRHSEKLPTSFKSLDLGKTDFRLTLVIKNHQEAWLQPIQDALRIALSPLAKTWALSANSVIVINDAIAQEHGLISAVNKL